MKTYHKNKEGFTLIEILIGVILLGIGIAGIVTANGSLTKLNGAAVELSTAEFLIEQIREQTAQMSFSDLVNLNGNTYSPPLDSQGELLNEFSDYTQSVSVVYVQNSDLSQISGIVSDYVRITIAIYRNSRLVTSGIWIRSNY